MNLGPGGAVAHSGHSANGWPSHAGGCSQKARRSSVSAGKNDGVGEGTQTAVHTAVQGALPTLERKPWPVAGSKFLTNGSCPTPHLVGASERCGCAAAWFGCGPVATWSGCGPAAASGSCSSGAAWDCCCPAASATPSGSEDLSEGLWAAELPLPLRWWWSVFAWWTSCS